MKRFSRRSQSSGDETIGTSVETSVHSIPAKPRPPSVPPPPLVAFRDTEKRAAKREEDRTTKRNLREFASSLMRFIKEGGDADDLDNSGTEESDAESAAESDEDWTPVALERMDGKLQPKAGASEWDERTYADGSGSGGGTSCWPEGFTSEQLDQIEGKRSTPSDDDSMSRKVSRIRRHMSEPVHAVRREGVVALPCLALSCLAP